MDMLPFTLTPFIKKLLSRLEAENCISSLAAIRAQVYKSDKESFISPEELPDPLGEHCYKVTHRLVHQYKNRALLLSTGTCFAYCRHCFRRNFAGRGEGWITEAELDEVCSYLTSHKEIEEILISGGDPLTVSDEVLESLFIRLREARPGILLRLCTRALFFAPERLTPSLISLLQKSKPLWVIPHINHPAEISAASAPESRSAIDTLINAGIPVQSQTVLLSGVNDDVKTLHTLFHDLVCLGVKPGYLFQTDLAQGTSHFRVPLEKAVKLYEELRKDLSGLSTPVFAVDLPGGGGKFNLLQLNNDFYDTKVSFSDTEFIFTRDIKTDFLKDSKEQDRKRGQWKYPRT
ncbi:MAG TPA: KamA family radical SAM protein [Treponemataceae bacterium]|jgi:lysine 2,3-aminomutase|nr:KamA family radical SAM protein [Treponemataceae bacterium]